MKTQRFYQSTKPVKKQPTNYDLLKGIVAITLAFIVSIGFVMMIVFMDYVAEFISNLFK